MKWLLAFTLLLAGCEIHQNHQERLPAPLVVYAKEVDPAHAWMSRGVFGSTPVYEPDRYYLRIDEGGVKYCRQVTKEAFDATNINDVLER